VDQLICEAADETEKTDAVEDHVATERPPRQRQCARTGQRTGAYDEHDVEHCRSDDRSDADITASYEHSDETGEQLRCAAPSRHQRRASHVLADTELGRDDLESWDEVLVADDR